MALETRAIAFSRINEAQGVTQAYTPVDKVTEKVWHSRQQFLVTTSGITLCTAGTCYLVQSGGNGARFKNAAGTPSPNQTVCLKHPSMGSTAKPPGICATYGRPNVGSRTQMNLYGIGDEDCLTPTSTVDFEWSVTHLGWRWQFRIHYETQVAPPLFTRHTVFEAYSTNWCFPQTVSNVLQSSDCPFNNISLMVHGYGGAATISIADCDCT